MLSIILFNYLKEKNDRKNNSNSLPNKIYNFDFSNMKITNTQETKNLQELIINDFNYYEEELQEMKDLEYQLYYLRENLSIYDYVLKPESLEIYKKNIVLSDIEEGYRSSNSVSDKSSTSIGKKNMINKNNEKQKTGKYPLLTSVTIDLNKDTNNLNNFAVGKSKSLKIKK